VTHEQVWRKFSILIASHFGVMLNLQYQVFNIY